MTVESEAVMKYIDIVSRLLANDPKRVMCTDGGFRTHEIQVAEIACCRKRLGVSNSARDSCGPITGLRTHHGPISSVPTQHQKEGVDARLHGPDAEKPGGSAQRADGSFRELQPDH